MKSFLKIIIFISLMVLLSGCVSSNNVTPVPTQTPAQTEIESIEIPVQTNDSGLTYEESLRINPPPPRNLTGEFKIDYIELHWDIPEKVTIPHNYSDIITNYKIYKGIREEDMSYLTSTSELTFKDSNISQDSQYVYEITAVYEGGSEGLPSLEVIVYT